MSRNTKTSQTLSSRSTRITRKNNNANAASSPNTITKSGTSNLNSQTSESGIMDGVTITQSPVISKPTSTTNNHTYIKTSEALNLISMFDGYNISVHKLIREVKNARNLVNPNDHKVFYYLVRAKIRGNAASYLDEKRFDS